MSQTFHPFFCSLAKIFEAGGVLVEETWLFQLQTQGLAHMFIIITENGLAKGFYLTNDIPRFIVGDILHDVFQQPLQ